MGLEKINEFKKNKQLTNFQLSQITGIAISTLDKITSGANKNPKLETLQLICKALDCTLDDLDDNSKSKLLLDEETEHIMKYRKLDEMGKHTVDTVLDVEYNRVQKNTKNIRLNNQTDDKLVNIPLVARGKVKGVQQLQVNEKEFDEEFKKLIPSDLDL